MRLMTCLGIFVVMTALTEATVFTEDDKMQYVYIDIGRPIEEIARSSGVPRFGIMKVAGLIHYSVSNFPRDVPVRFARDSLEIEISPVFYLSIATDQDRSPNKIVSSAAVLIDTTSLKTHQEALHYVEGILRQFNSKQWSRHIRANCPAVTGRSSILNAEGEVGSLYCGIDPHYRMTLKEWEALTPRSLHYTWVAEGIIATIDVSSSTNKKYGLSYSIRLEFEDLKTRAAIDADNTARGRAKGDAKGWNTTARELKEEEEQRQLVKQLEKNAVERGDRVIRR